MNLDLYDFEKKSWSSQQVWENVWNRNTSEKNTIHISFYRNSAETVDRIGNIWWTEIKIENNKEQALCRRDTHSDTFTLFITHFSDNGETTAWMQRINQR